LTHTVIKEHEDEAASIAESATTDGTEDMTDDQLALLGPPWAKEGNLQRKPYWEGPGKRSKEKNWRQVFTVLQQGDIYMFSFDEGSGRAVPKGLAMGGGNWMVSGVSLG
jgi:PH/SEC7 domain-containing protein